MHDFLYSICGTKCERFSSVQVQAYSESCYIHENKAAKIPPYRLMFIFSQHRRHGCRMAFSLLEFVHRIISPASNLFGKLLHPQKAKRYSFHPYRLMFFSPTQTARLPQGVFSTRICTLNYFASADNSNLANPSGKLLHLTQNKSGTVSTHTA